MNENLQNNTVTLELFSFSNRSSKVKKYRKPHLHLFKWGESCFYMDFAWQKSKPL